MSCASVAEDNSLQRINQFLTERVLALVAGSGYCMERSQSRKNPVVPFRALLGEGGAGREETQIEGCRERERLREMQRENMGMHVQLLGRDVVTWEWHNKVPDKTPSCAYIESLHSRLCLLF